MMTSAVYGEEGNGAANEAASYNIEESIAGEVEAEVKNELTEEELQLLSPYDIRRLGGHWDSDDEARNLIMPDGDVLCKSWVYDNGNWFFLDSTGSLMTGKVKIKGKRYFFYDTGVMATGWIYDEEKAEWGYADESGELHTGWLQSGDIWYWFDSSGVMYKGGDRMINGHKYYFYENGQMAADKFASMNFYNSDGVKTNSHRITIKGKRSITADEKAEITRQMAEIPSYWVRKFINDGWELMFFTDRKYFQAPSTESGIYYVYYQTDIKYKKLKITNPKDLRMAFGEYIAYKTGNYSDLKDEYTTALEVAGEYYSGRQLPSYFDSNTAMQFAASFEAWSDPLVKSKLKEEGKPMLEKLDRLFKSDSFDRKPEDADEYYRMKEEDLEGGMATGPAKEIYEKRAAERQMREEAERLMKEAAERQED